MKRADDFARSTEGLRGLDYRISARRFLPLQYPFAEGADFGGVAAGFRIGEDNSFEPDFAITSKSWMSRPELKSSLTKAGETRAMPEPETARIAAICWVFTSMLARVTGHSGEALLLRTIWATRCRCDQSERD